MPWLWICKPALRKGKEKHVAIHNIRGVGVCVVCVVQCAFLYMTSLDFGPSTQSVCEAVWVYYNSEAVED